MREIRHIFNIDDSEIDNEISKRCMQLFDIVNNSPLSNCIDVLIEKPSILQSPLNNTNTLTTKNDIRHHIFPLLFSYDLLFFTHLCLCDLFVDGVIKPIHIETLYDAINRYI